MKHAEYFRNLARLCRVLSKNTDDPQLVDQMQVWAVDFAEEADKAERQMARHDRYLKTKVVGSSGPHSPRSTRPTKAEMIAPTLATAHPVSSAKWDRRSG